MVIIDSKIPMENQKVIRIAQLFVNSHTPMVVSATRMMNVFMGILPRG